MIEDEILLRPRYGEVDKMGYVYHANYTSYCHQARTELLRKFGLNDKLLEDKNIMMPVISFNIEYKRPAHYDEQIKIKTIIKEIPKVRFTFEFIITNMENKVVCKANSTVVFVNSDKRNPIIVPDFIVNILHENFNEIEK